MKRIGWAALFFVVGIVTTWAAMWTTSHMPHKLQLNLVPRISGDCDEIGPCSLPWWASSLFLVYVLGPSLAFALTGWLSARPGVDHVKGVPRLVRLIAGTVLFYFVASAIGRGLA